MQKISYWASRHIMAARFFIVIIKIALVVLACYTGTTLYKMHLLLPANLFYGIAFLLMAAAVIFYPADKKTNNRKLLFARKKISDFILPLSAVLLITAWVNNADVVHSNTAAYGSNIVKRPTAQEILKSGKTRAELTGREKRVLKREFFKQLKIYAAATLSGDKARAGEAWKIILAIIALVGLLYLLAALVCSLSCNGSDTAAVLVGVLGLAGLIWGFIAILKAINRKQKKTETAKLE